MTIEKKSTIPKYCPWCGKENTLKESDENCTDYYVVGITWRCQKCGKGFGFPLEDIKPDLACDNTNHTGKAEHIKRVEMKPEFEGGFYNWCERCRTRDKDMIKVFNPQPTLSDALNLRLYPFDPNGK